MDKYLITLIFIFLSTCLYSKDNLEKVSLQLLWEDQFQFAGYYIAKEKGFYRDVGLDVDIKKYDKNETSFEKIINKKATYAIGGSSIISKIDNNNSIMFLYALFQSSPIILLALEDSNISSIRDFIGKKAMFSNESLNGVPLASMLSSEGVKPNMLKLQTNSYNINDLIDKKTDVMSAYISNEPFILKERGIKYKIFNPKDYGFDFYGDILFTSLDEIKKHKDRAIKFKHASLKGWKYAFEHIEESVNLILKKYNTQNKSKDALIFEANKLKELAYYKTDKLGSIDENKIQRIYDIYNLKGLIHNKIEIKKYIFKEKNNIHFTKNEQDFIFKNHTVKYVYDPDWRPFEWKNGLNEHAGIIADILKLVSQRSGIKFEAVNTDSWTESVKLVKLKSVDMFSAVPVTKERKEYLNFTKSNIYSYPAVFVSNTKNKDIILNDIQENIKNKIVGILKSNSLGIYIKNRYAQAKFIELDSMEEGFEKLKNNEIDLFAINAVSANYYITNKGYSDAKIYSSTDYMFELKIALQKNLPPELLSILNKSLRDITAQEKKSIFLKWITLKIQNRTDWTIVWQIIAIGIFLLLIFLYISSHQIKHNRTLSKEINDRKEAEKKLEEINITLDERVKSAVLELEDKNQKLQNANNDFQELLNSTMEMIFISDENQNIIEANKIALELFNIKDISELKNKNLFDTVEKSSKLTVQNALKECSTQPYEINIRIKERGIVPVLASGKNIIRNGKKMRISTLIDISKLKHAQHQLIQQSRLAQMGEMISMIAHQWRQPLSAISATSGSLTLKAKLGKLDNELALELSEKITQYTHHLSTTIDDFRNFFKKNRTKDVTTLENIVNATLNIVELSLKDAHIELIIESTSTKELKTYINEVQQVVLNIIKNAQDALIENNIENPKIILKIEDTTLTISDNAGGIPENIMNKIFTPYFSTKTKKDGTGLGLYMSKTIIQEHCKGELSVYNNQYGATFKIVL